MNNKTNYLIVLSFMLTIIAIVGFSNLLQPKLRGQDGEPAKSQPENRFDSRFTCEGAFEEGLWTGVKYSYRAVYFTNGDIIVSGTIIQSINSYHNTNFISKYEENASARARVVVHLGLFESVEFMQSAINNSLTIQTNLSIGPTTDTFNVNTCIYEKL
jgi:hypothetical protein